MKTIQFNDRNVSVTMTYDDILSMIHSEEFLIIEWAKSLPYSEELLFNEDTK